MKNKNLPQKDYVLVYSDDPRELTKCAICKKSQCTCTCTCTCTNKVLIPLEHTIKIRLEKNGRGGKIVTVLFELKSDYENYYKELTKSLKNICGTGGAYKETSIEIQGDHREKCKNHLEKLGFKIKLAGG